MLIDFECWWLLYWTSHKQLLQIPLHHNNNNNNTNHLETESLGTLTHILTRRRKSKQHHEQKGMDWNGLEWDTRERLLLLGETGSHIGTLALISERLTSSCSLPSSTTESMALDS